jgi:hypothetical protein
MTSLLYIFKLDFYIAVLLYVTLYICYVTG